MRRGAFLDRRSVLTAVGSGWVCAATAAWGQDQGASKVSGAHMPAGLKTAADFPISETMTRLAAYISQARQRPLPAQVVEHTKWHVLDTLAAIVSGSQLPGGRASIAYARTIGAPRGTTVIASDVLCDPTQSAMLNGVMAHSDETDDTISGPWHPGTNVVPTALALGELDGIDGASVLRAVALGYDVGSRLMQAAGATLNYKTPTNSLGGVFGATATAASLAGLRPEQVRWALSYAAQQSSGLDSFRRDPDHIEKGFMNAGLGARAGVTSALLVRSGFTAVNDVFSGPANFFELYAATAKPELLVAGLGEEFLITRSEFKRWPVGGPIQVTLDGMRALLKRRPIAPDQIRDIVIQHAPDFVTDNGGPLDVNVQHAVALMLVDGRLTFRNVHDRSRFADPRVLRLRTLCRLEAGPPRGQAALESLKFGGVDEQMPLIQITLADGSKVTQGTIRDAIGTPANPYTRAWVIEKATTLMTPVLGGAVTESLVQRVMNLESVRNMRELRPLLQLKGPQGPPRLSTWPEAS